MSLDREAVERLLAALPAEVRPLRQPWLDLMAQALWADLPCSRMGGLTRLRKRLLEHGEVLAAMERSRDWIPHPRERLKSVIGGAIKLRDTLAQVQRAAEAIDDGGESGAFLVALAAYGAELEARLAPLENRSAALLDGLHRAGRDDDS